MGKSIRNSEMIMLIVCTAIFVREGALGLGTYHMIEAELGFEIRSTKTGRLEFDFKNIGTSYLEIFSLV
jgi:hypothetical protein